MVTAGMLPRAAVREVEARLRAAGCPDADFDAAELFRLAAGGMPALPMLRWVQSRQSGWKP